MKVTEAFRVFLDARKLPANADLVARWSPAMETQLNVAAGNGEPVDGKRSTYSDGINEWWSIRLPKKADSDPEWPDYELGFPFELHAEAIGCTGWDWQARRSRWVAFDFDALTTHAKGVGISDEDLEKVELAAEALPYVQTRQSTGGKGRHLYVYFDDAGIPTANHTEHAALARCILGMMSSETNFDFASQIDACGGNMWIWARKMTAENGGLSLIKAATKTLSVADLPANWRDHVEVVTKKRSKVRVNAVAEDDLDPFEALASSRKIIPLDDSHKAQIDSLMRSIYTTLWIADHHLLQAHTCALAEIMGEADLKLIGCYKTSSDGKNPGSPNCFLFPLPKGAWKVYRFSQGVSEAETWSQDGEGWTTCYFNRRPDLAAAAKSQGGIEDHQKGGYVFDSVEPALQAAALIGQKIEVRDDLRKRQTVLKPHRDGRLVVQIQKTETDDPFPGWLAKKDQWTRVFDVITEPREDELATTQFDDVVRHVEDVDGGDAGWLVRKKRKWGREPFQHVKVALQRAGDIPKAEAEIILGGSVLDPWQLVNLPFSAEYPGGRRWNRDAAQYACQPVVLTDDEAPKHPTWDLVFNHTFGSLTAALKDLQWARDANIRTGGDYGRAWVACMLRCPFEPLPYLFFHGPEGSGKSIYHEAVALLMTKGCVMADRALTTKGDFNGELANAILCIIEEKNVAKYPGAMARIKEWVTCRRLSIRKMRTDTFEQDSTLHFAQFNNKRASCPVFPGDTRITVIEVPRFAGVEIPKEELLERLGREAPHFLRTLMDLQLPAKQGRLRIPLVETNDKVELAAEMSPVSLFVTECCEIEAGLRIIKKVLCSAYNTWAYDNGYENLEIGEFGAQLLSLASQIKAKGQKKDEKDGKMKHCYDGVCLKGGAA
jgi:hypothetical protein